jgi:hypothetical protein
VVRFIDCLRRRHGPAIYAAYGRAMSTYRLRVEVPAQPVAPVRVADAISAAGGSIVSVDLREVDGPSAVDEIVVEVPGDMARQTVIAAVDDAPGATLLSSQRCTPERLRRQAREWKRADPRLATQRHAAALPQQLAAACPLARAWVRDATIADEVPAAAMALERGGPVAQRSATLPDPALERPRSPIWLLAVPDQYPDADNIALLTRPTALRFSTDEVARVEVLLSA